MSQKLSAMPQKKVKHLANKSEKVPAINPFQRSAVSEVGIPYHTELDPLKNFCTKGPNLEWLRKERALIAINYARGLELWLIKARNAAFENQELADMCGFMALLNETEKEVAHYSAVTQKLFHHNPQPSQCDLDKVGTNACNIPASVEVNKSHQENQEETKLPPIKSKPNSRRKLSRCFSFSKMFSRFRRSVSRHGGSTHRNRHDRRSLLHESDKGSEVSSLQPARKTSLSEGYLSHYQMDSDPKLWQEGHQTGDDSLLFSPGLCPSPMHFSFSEIWPIHNEAQRFPMPLNNEEEMATTKDTQLLPLSTYNPDHGSNSFATQMPSTQLTLHATSTPAGYGQNNGMELEDSDFKTLEVMSFKLPSHPEMQVELHVLLQNNSTESEFTTTGDEQDGDKHGRSPEVSVDVSPTSESDTDTDSCDPLIDNHNNPFTSFWSINL